MALIEKLNAIGDAIRDKTGGTEKLTLEQMPTEIESIETGGVEVEPIVLSGFQERACSGEIASAYIDKFSDTISTLDLTDADSMFFNFTGKYIPFDINFKKTKDNTHSATSFFNGCKNLKELPKVNNLYVYSHLQNFFFNCCKLREIPEDYFDSWSYSPSMYSSTRHNSMFYKCYSLRSMPLGWLKNLNANAYSTSSFYYEGFYCCYVLDELVNIPIPYTATWTSNAFQNTFFSCYRLKRITFETNEDGTPIVVQWKSQTIDLTQYVGYAQLLLYITSYNSGIPDVPPKEVWSDKLYNQLKDDPDWYTKDIQYSRYNRTSAVETINSLPDTSAYLATAGGTNTIKFKGVAGSATDGGAINTMTEEEIAVAAAKGWTVSFV